MKKISFVFQLLISTTVLAVPLVSQADYVSYTYSHSKDNYHLTNTSVSNDGTVIAAVGGTSVVASDEVVVFGLNTTEPVWTFDDIGDSNIFDLDLSGDGTTAVVCGGGVWLLDIENEALLWAFDDDYRVWDTCDISEDGNTVLAGNRQSGVASWDRSSSEIVRYWTFADGGFVNVVDMTEDGKQAIAATSYSYGLMDIVSDNFTWEKVTDVEVYTAGLSNNGRRAYVVLDDGKLGTDIYFLRGVGLAGGNVTWRKRFSSYNTPRVQISNSGERIMLTTNDEYFGLNRTGKVEWTFSPAGQETDMQMSSNGKFVTVAEGLYYTYFFDWDYPKNKHRAVQIDRPTFPGAVGVSADGSTVAYADEDFVVQEVKPGILVDNQDTIPVYFAGRNVGLRYFVSNPGEQANLKIRTSLSLPQVSVLADVGAEVDGDPKGIRSKLLEYANATLPGYEVIDTRSVAVSAHNSKTVTTAVLVPDMIMPDWIGDFLELIGLDDFFDTLMGDYADPMKTLLNNKVNSAMTEDASAQVSAGDASYALFGLGQVELYDAETNEVYSTDTFYFMYLVIGGV
ncbi:MAG: WD40 repeat domain-containing protein [Candidatus Kerfeldbacteria bacterium]|nr:WD40 repeat domain-containing protein [Candidatus Kerfeldbacteria bacterium]